MKLSLGETCPDETGSYDWEGIRAILQVMFTAFREVGAKATQSGAIYEKQELARAANLLKCHARERK